MLLLCVHWQTEGLQRVQEYVPATISVLGKQFALLRYDSSQRSDVVSRAMVHAELSDLSALFSACGAAVPTTVPCMSLPRLITPG